VSPTATQSFTLTVLPILITTMSLPSGMAGTTYSTSVVVVGGNPPYKWKVISGSLPKGIKLNKLTGVISGTPSKKAVSSTFSVEVLDTKVKVRGHPPTQNTATAQLSITITP
jgi:Putative Ig domain